MNGYSNNGFTKSLNGILSLTDGLGTTIENGEIKTGDITGEDIVSSTVTTNSLKSTSHELTGSLIVDENISVGGTTTLDGIITSNDTTDATSLLDNNYSIKINGGAIIKKNLYATDIMSDNLVSGNIGCGNLNSSNNITCVELRTNTITCDTLISSDFYYKNQIACYINIGVAPYLKIPLSTSIYDTTNDVVNYDLSTVLTNSNNNTIFVLPYYIITFFNNHNIIFISDNLYGSILLYDTINFSPNITCTKIIISYKTKIV